MKAKFKGNKYATKRSESYEWCVDYCLEKNYTQMMTQTGRSITRHYALFSECVAEGSDWVKYYMNNRLDEILDAKYLLYLHEVIMP